MNKLRMRVACIVVLGAALGLAHAADTEAPAAAVAATAKSLQLPRLEISWDCKDCKQNDKVVPLIEEAYAAAAAKGGYAVSESETAAFAISDFRQRPPAVRATLGFFAGKDRLAVRGSYHGKDVEADDYSANAVQGVNHLCETVARKVYDAIVAKARAEHPDVK